MTKHLGGSFLAFSLAAFVACSSFEEEGTTPPPATEGGVDAGSEAPTADVGITFKPIPPAAPVYLIQTRDTEIPFDIERRPGSSGPIVVSIPKLPNNATAAPVTIPAGQTAGKIVIRPALTTPQGPINLDLEALESVPNGAGAKTTRTAYVRGLPGTLDTSFGSGGIAKQLYMKSGYTGTIGDLAVGDDGSIFFTGRREGANPAYSIAVSKLLPSGLAFDTTFAMGHYTTGGSQAPNAVALHDPTSALKDVVDAMSGEPLKVYLHRLDVTGKPVGSFNGGNPVITVFPGLTNPTGIQIASPSSGNILLLAYYNAQSTLAVSSWKADGTIDANYGLGSGCKFDATTTGSTVSPSARMLARPDGSVVVAFGIGTDFAMKICSATGIVDTMGGPPPYYQTVGGAGVVTDMSAVPGGGFVVLSNDVQGPRWRRFSNQLVQDKSIGVAGAVAIPGPSAEAILATTDGILTARGDTEFIRVVRHRNDGTIDTTFGEAGTLSISVAGPVMSTAARLVAQRDGRILVGGSASIDSAIARFWP